MTAPTADIAKQFDEQGARKTEAIYLTPDVIAQRARVLEMLALQPGERVVDLGCGPGLLALEMGETGGRRRQRRRHRLLRQHDRAGAAPSGGPAVGAGAGR